MNNNLNPFLFAYGNLRLEWDTDMNELQNQKLHLKRNVTNDLYLAMSNKVMSNAALVFDS